MFERGRYFSTSALRIHYLATDRELSRLGLVVSRRKGNSVVRSLIKRRLREAYRHRKNELPAAFDVVLIPRGSGARPLSDYLEAIGSFTMYATRKHRERSASNDSKDAGDSMDSMDSMDSTEQGGSNDASPAWNKSPHKSPHLEAARPADVASADGGARGSRRPLAGTSPSARRSPPDRRRSPA